MALPYPPIDSNTRIPNNPFYSPEQNYIKGEYSPFIIGSGLYLDNVTGVLSATGSGSPGVASVTGGAGIVVSASTGAVTISNSGVLNIVGGAGIGVTKVGGNYTITNTAPALSGGGTVTSITAGAGLAGGTITSFGTISLATTGVGPGTYTSPTLTIDAYGRITRAIPGSGGGGGGAAFPVLANLPLRSDGLLPSTISIDLASTSAPGAVQLNNTVTSTSSTQAATARAVSETYTLASDAQAIAGNATTVAQNACTVANNASIVASSAQATATQALTCASVAKTDAVQALADAATAQTTANTAQITANTADATANTALNIANGAVQRSSFTGPGQLLVGTGSGIFAALNPGTNGYVLAACSASPTGLAWRSAVASGTVTCVEAGTGLCGGPITSSGALCLTNTGVLAGTYNNASFTVDAQGRICSASSNPTPLTAISASSPLAVTTGPVPVLTVCNASLASRGVVQLYNGTNSLSITQALTACQGKVLQDQINALSTAANLTLAGTFDASTSQMVTVTADGLTSGFIVGSNIPNASTGNANYFVIVTVGGSYTPPGGSTPYNASQGDWFLSNGSSWQFLNVGPTVPYATTSTPGSVCLSTNALAIAGTDGNTAITPSVGRATYIFKCDYTAKGAIVAGTGTATTSALAVGANGSVLVACSTCPTGLTWSPAGAPAIPCACVTGKGAIITGTGANAPAALPVGANGLILTADSTTSTGLAWCANTAIPCSVITGKGDIVIGTSANTPTALPAGLDNYILTADSACPSGLKWAAAAVTGVTCVCTGTGLTGGPISSTGTIALDNTTVSPGTYTNATITVDQQGRLTSALSGAAPTGGTVTCVCAGTGLTGGPISTTGTISLENTAVTPGCYTFATVCVDQQGRITSAACGTAVTCVCTSTGLIGGPIGTTGTIALANTTVTPGNYTYATVCVDQQGRITLASSGTAPNTTVSSPIVNTGTAIEPVIGVQTATTGQLGAVQVGSNIDVTSGVISVATSSTTVPGIVQLNDTVASTSTTEALTAAQGKVLQDQINTLSVTTNLTLAGTFDAATSQMLSVTSSGSSAGFTIGADLPASAPALTDFFVIVTTGGNYSPPGGGGPYPANQGDWFLNNGTSWQYLNVGTDLPIASTGTQGIVQLATPAETATGTSTTLAVTPAGAAATYVPIDQLTGQGALITATAANTPATLALGTNGQVLTACNAAPEGLCWTTAVTCVATSSALTGGPITTTGTLDLATTGVTAATYTYPDSVSVDACGRITALSSAAASPITCLDFDAKGDLLAGFGSDLYGVLPVGSEGNVLTACPAAPSGLCWAPASVPAIPCACITAKGDIIVGSAASTPTALPVGTNGQYLVACSACPSGLTWGAGATVLNLYPVIRTACYTASIPSPAYTSTVICYNTAICDSTGWYNGSTGVFKPTVPGYYQITANARIYGQNNCVVEGTLFLCCNGTQINNEGGFGVVGGGLSTLVYMNGSTDALCVGSAIGTTSGSNALSIGNARFTAILAQSQAAATQICGDTPVGAINWFGATSAPNGWLVADGRAVSRTGYADLFAVVGTTYGAGDGSTTFNLPDLRGQFIRGWDAAGGTARGCDPGRVFGSNQGSAFGAHCHTATVVNGLAGRPEWALPDPSTGNASGYPSCSAGSPAQRAGGFTTTVGGTETRPTNVALLPCIKYATTLAPANAACCGIPCSTLVSKGSIVTATSPNTPVALPVGNNGQILVANSSCSSGLQWQTGAVDPWVSAGTIQAVGWNSTGGVLVVPGTTSRNNVSYRQLGAKEWEVVYSFTSTGNFTNGGSGNYLFTLPAGIQFDTTLPWQPAYTAIVGASYANYQYFLPSGSVRNSFANGGNGSVYGAGIVVYDATRFRIFSSDTGNGGPQPVANNYWGNSNGWSFTAAFQISSL